MKKKRIFGGFVAASALFLAACGGESDTTAAGENGEPIEVTIGVVGEVNEPWDYTIEQLKEKENIDVTLTKFTDYATPNTALADGSIDLNAFQTEIFLDEYNENAGEDLTVIGYTVMAPLGIYSLSIKDVADLPDGAEIGIPNDGSNTGRALNLLQTAGLIEIDPEAGLLPTQEDIVANPHNFVFHELDSSQTARALEDLDASVVNSGMAVDAGFIPTEDAIFLEPVTEESAPYYNTIVARPEEADNEVYQTIVEYYQSEGTAEVIEESSKGSSIPIWDEAK
ncbi:MetQ/NlpA family ABC transporter substrate-binding protein [Jeotgalibaca caeni]|uniref:MetQ/NlpA family ABC transporter substrate-binding protein n=1 Tax=Jeotgalibaca caeni TaxID=3028623 RepID=UPI00237E3DC8|nr:MetQ/NlpA family ABC transporter substrate-binding protein [Jeotgalibaca caeni]MDE1549218.1 MetQ/NlpA family ABC transporter substrate-binding protein [Jeotgalibaca caeni]